MTRTDPKPAPLDRRRLTAPTAYPVAPPRSGTTKPDATVMITTGRGDARCTPAEARALARDLLAAAGPPPADAPDPAPCLWCRAAATRHPGGLLCPACFAALEAA